MRKNSLELKPCDAIAPYYAIYGVTTNVKIIHWPFSGRLILMALLIVRLY